MPIRIRIFTMPKLSEYRSIFGRTAANFIWQFWTNTAAYSHYSGKKLVDSMLIVLKTPVASRLNIWNTQQKLDLMLWRYTRFPWHILDINHITSIVDVLTIFGQTHISDNFLTRICLVSQTLTDSDRYFSETGTTKSSASGQHVSGFSPQIGYIIALFLELKCFFFFNTVRLCEINSEPR